MLIHQEHPDNKRKFVAKSKFVAHLSRDEMLMLERALKCYGGQWDNDKAWEASYQIRKMLDSTHITMEDMLAEEAALNKA